MNIEKRLNRWLEAKLIDQKQKDAILQFEHDQPSATWVIIGISLLGVVVILTGVISIIAANWNNIGELAKLVLYFLGMIALGISIVRTNSARVIVRECLLLGFMLYALAGIGLIGQIYHLESESYRAVFFWIAIVLPVALLGTTRFVGNAWFTGLVTAMILWVTSAHGESEGLDRAFVSLALPYAVLGLGYLGGQFCSAFCSAARIASYTAILVGIGIFGNIAWAAGNIDAPVAELGQRPLLVLGAMIFSVIAVLLRKIQPGNFLTATTLTTIGISALMVVPFFYMKIEPHRVIGCALFILMWSAAATTAAALEIKRLFDLAALVIGIRFIVVYFEVFGSLAATGIGLILSGGVILGVAYLWHKYRGDVRKAIREAA